MLKICDFNTFYSPSGGGVRQYLDRKFDFYKNREDVRYTVIVPGERNDMLVRGAARWYTIRAFPVPGAANYRWLPGVRELRRIIQQEQPHIIEVGAPYLSPLLIRWATRGLNCRLVGFWHADYPDTYVVPALKPLGNAVAKMGGQLAWAYARATIGRYDAVFAASGVVALKLEAHGIRAVHRTPLGVDTALFSPAQRNGNHSDMTTTSEPRKILYVGRLSAEKGVRTLVDAFPLIVREHPDVQLWVVGHGPMEKAVRQLEKDYPSVRWLGFCDSRQDHAKLVADVAVSVTPSGHETFSLTTLEALSCGTPIVCADEGGAAELAVRSGVGTLFRVDDAPDLARAVGEVLSWSAGKRRINSELARDFVVRHHHWDHVLAHQHHCYQLVMEASGR